MNRIQNSRRNTKNLNRFLILVFILIEVILLFVLVTAFYDYFHDRYSTARTNDGSIYNLASTALIIIWIGILVGFYGWAIYFYNINLGLTNEDWAEIRAKEKDEFSFRIRTENPNKDETLGLPKGTIRASLSLSLVVGALAMVISSLDKDSSLEANQLFVDNLEFFKTAFLMMIAFYFGNKSLEYLRGKDPKPDEHAPDGLEPDVEPPSEDTPEAPEADTPAIDDSNLEQPGEETDENGAVG
ncbi:hypothetical protein QQ008_13240 [Fulvivirgaceae bacterium BMA10]|uniref:Uncharacterized protein n=1 Tax=Splendidivirga corallicola TaxID=3051826 RepID=A0ABT8KNP0_9BACT|nr:hypothetical protein [Fulvivirgaceae bacterium BMA10]